MHREDNRESGVSVDYVCGMSPFEYSGRQISHYRCLLPPMPGFKGPLEGTSLHYEGNVEAIRPSVGTID